MHFHRDMLAVCDGYAGNVLRARPDDRFIGSAPLAFTFGFGGVLFPMHIGASFVVLEKAGAGRPAGGDRALSSATVCFTAPTVVPRHARQARRQARHLARCANASPPARPCRRATFDAWLKATGIKLIDGIGSTEMLHIFISATEDEIRPGATGKPVPGYEAKIVDDEGHDLPAGTMGRLAVRGPTGCRYLADERQRKYVSERLEPHRRHLCDG